MAVVCAVVTPYIIVHDAEEDDQFLERAFGTTEIGRSMAPEGRIANCQIKFDVATIMISEASEAFPPSSAGFYLCVAKADASTERALEGKAQKIMDAADMLYGDRKGDMRDPSGNIW